MARMIDGGLEGYVYTKSTIKSFIDDYILEERRMEIDESKITIIDVEYFLQECNIEVVASRQNVNEMEVTFKHKNKKYTIKHNEKDDTYTMFTPTLMLGDSAYGNGTSIHIPHSFIEVLKAWIKELEETC